MKYQFNLVIFAKDPGLIKVIKKSMHLSDAFVSAPVAIATDILAVSLIALSANKLKNNERGDTVALMGVMGAFVFVAQMINFTIPGTGSSGHLIGGILLAALMGPWAAFITLSSILIVQCLIFADGGLLALGCNILNMAATTCLIAYPLIFKPIVKNKLTSKRLLIGSIAASVIALEMGAFMVTAETEISGITSLSFPTFLGFMLPIHLAIGIVEGIITAVLLIFIAKYNPSIYQPTTVQTFAPGKRKSKIFYGAFIAATLVIGLSFSVVASQNPDGLEWSVEKAAPEQEFISEIPSTALMPEYDSVFAGIAGAVIVMVLLWAISSLCFRMIKKKNEPVERTA